MASRYYSIEISQVPFRYLCHAIGATMPRPVAWLIAAMIRLGSKVGLRLPPTYGDAFPGEEHLIDPQQLPPQAIARWAPLLEQLRDLGFEPLKTEHVPTVGGKLHYSTVLLDRPGTTMATLEWTRTSMGESFEEDVPLELNSYCDQGHDVVTGIVRKRDVPMAEVLQLDFVDMISVENNRPLAQRYREHQERQQGRRILQLTAEEALPVMRQRGEQRFNSLLAQGLLRELTAAEVEKLSQVDQSGLRAN